MQGSLPEVPQTVCLPKMSNHAPTFLVTLVVTLLCTEYVANLTLFFIGAHAALQSATSSSSPIIGLPTDLNSISKGFQDAFATASADQLLGPMYFVLADGQKLTDGLQVLSLLPALLVELLDQVQRRAECFLNFVDIARR